MQVKRGYVHRYSNWIAIDHDPGDEDASVWSTKIMIVEEVPIEQWQAEQAARGQPISPAMLEYARDLNLLEGT